MSTIVQQIPEIPTVPEYPGRKFYSYLVGRGLDYAWKTINEIINELYRGEKDVPEYDDDKVWELRSLIAWWVYYKCSRNTTELDDSKLAEEDDVYMRYIWLMSAVRMKEFYVNMSDTDAGKYLADNYKTVSFLLRLSQSTPGAVTVSCIKGRYDVGFSIRNIYVVSYRRTIGEWFQYIKQNGSSEANIFDVGQFMELIHFCIYKRPLPEDSMVAKMKPYWC